MSQAAGRYPGRAPIEAYGNGGFRFAGMSHRGSVLLLPSAIVAWPVVTREDLSPEAFEPIIAEKAQISMLLLGIGKTIAPAPAFLAPLLQEHGIGLDVMDTGAAARTYNILLAEGRRAAAALIAVD
jgi:uncharacterized protein